MINTAEMIVRIGQMHCQLQEATAKGFNGNIKALFLLAQIRETFDKLEELADNEFWGGADARLIQESNGSAG